MSRYPVPAAGLAPSTAGGGEDVASHDVQRLEHERVIRRAGEDDHHLLIGKDHDELPAAAARAIGRYVAVTGPQRAEPPLVSVSVRPRRRLDLRGVDVRGRRLLHPRLA